MNGSMTSESTTSVEIKRAMFARERHMLVDAPLKVVHKRRHVSASRPEGPSEPVHRNAMRSISFGVRASNLIGFTCAGSPSASMSSDVLCRGGCFSESKSSTNTDRPSNSVIRSSISRTPEDEVPLVSSVRVCSTL